MPNNYLYYNTSDSSYTFSLINKTVSTNKKTRVYLGDTTNEIYTDASNQLKVTSNFDVEKSLKVTQNLRADGELSIGYSSSPSINYNLLAKSNKLAINKSDVNATYTLDVGGSAKIDSDFYVTGNTTLAGGFNTNGNFTVSSDKFIVNATTGNTTVYGDLTVNGNTNLGNQTTDTTTISGDLIVNGNFLGRTPLGSILPLVTGYFINPTGGVNTGNTGTYTSVSSLIPTSGTITPDGFLLCNGALIPTTANSLLASISGGEQRYTPDLTDSRFLQGSTSSGSISTVSGSNNGDNTVTLTISNIPSHNHSGSFSSNNANITVTAGSITPVTDIIINNASDSIPAGYQIITGGNQADKTPRIGVSGFPIYQRKDGYSPNPSVSQSTHSHTISSEGGSQSFNIRPKYMNVIYVMRVK